MVAVGRSLLLFAALAALLTVQAATDATAKFSPLFVNWLSQQTSTKIRTAGYYEEVETESVCLQEVAYRNCRCFHTEEVFNQTVCPHDYIETKVACCKDPHYAAKHDLITEIPTVGVCSYSEEYFDSPVTYDGTECSKIGIFSVTCELRDEADKCGEPLYEGMSFTAQGDILRYPSVAFIGMPTAITQDDSCKTSTPNPLRKGGRNANTDKSAAGQKPKSSAPAKVQYDGGDGGDEGPGGYDGGVQYYLGQGDIYSGAFLITSRHHKVPFKTGQYQLVFASNIVDPLPLDAPPENSYVAKSNAIVLEFYKSESY